jgi:hypothetical protein
VQFGFNPTVRKLKAPFPTLDFESKKLEAVCDVHNPSLLPVERHTKLIKNLYCPSQGMFRLSSRPTGHNPVIRPSCELVSLASHLLVKRSQQDIAQQRRKYAPCAKGNFSFERVICDWRTRVAVLDLRLKK